MILNIGYELTLIEGCHNIDLSSSAKGLGVRPFLGLPYPTGTFKAIRCERFIEKLSQQDGYSFFREARRVLGQGGVLRVSTPDLDWLLGSYLSGLRMQWEDEGCYEYIQTRCEMINIAFRCQDRQWTYGKEEILNMGKRTGFRDAYITNGGESKVQAFAGLDTNQENLVVEFIKAQPSSSRSPKVSVLIPAFNPTYFEQSLCSAIGQSFEDYEIIVSDDSAGNHIKELTDKHILSSTAPIMYIKNRRPKGARGNLETLLEVREGTYVKFLNDDDLLMPNCLSRMCEVLDKYKDVSLVTSYRQRIDESGCKMPDSDATKPILQEDGLLHGQHIFSILRYNTIGEPTTAMFRADDLKVASLDKGLCELFGLDIGPCVDMVMWLKLLSFGDLAYIAEPLSQFRQHPDQEQRDPRLAPLLRKAWSDIFATAERVGMRRTLPSHAFVTPL